MSDQIFDLKKEKYLSLRDKFSDQYDKKLSIHEVRALGAGTKNIQTAGRIVGMRSMGKIIFSQLYDFSGKIQLYYKKDDENSLNFKSFQKDLSIGDFIGVSGELFLTKTGELSLKIDSWSLLNKCLRPLPEKYHGLEDIELRYRRRYLDIIMNENSRHVFKKRFELIKIMRRFLEDHGYLEIETPILQNQASGALAKPFLTHHNALDMDCVLRIACETYLKRCIGAGMDKVFEFARCFRNEGISATHLQDFTMLEFYAAYWNSETMMPFVESMIRNLIENLFGKLEITLNGHKIDFSQKWPVYDYGELIQKDCGVDIFACKSKEELLAILKAKEIYIEDAKNLSLANLIDALYKKVSRPKLIHPCFLVKYPVEMAPLARRNKDNESLVDFFQLIVNGVEIVKAYSELVDPIDQRERFVSQAQARLEGDEESMPMDEDFISAMEYGFPPVTGVGIGIDRLIMILCECENIKDTVLFPLLRNQTEPESSS